MTDEHRDSVPLRIPYTSVACPRCRAQRGKGCVTPGGRESVVAHVERRRIVDEMERTAQLNASINPPLRLSDEVRGVLLKRTGGDSLTFGGDHLSLYVDVVDGKICLTVVAQKLRRDMFAGTRDTFLSQREGGIGIASIDSPEIRSNMLYVRGLNEVRDDRQLQIPASGGLVMFEEIVRSVMEYNEYMESLTTGVSAASKASSDSERSRSGLASRVMNVIESVTGARLWTVGGEFLRVLVAVTDDCIKVQVVQQKYRGDDFNGGSDVFNPSAVNGMLSSKSSPQVRMVYSDVVFHVRGTLGGLDRDFVEMPRDNQLQTFEVLLLLVWIYNGYMARVEHEDSSAMPVGKKFEAKDLRLEAAGVVNKVTGAASCNFGGRFLELVLDVTDGRLGLVVVKQMFRGMRFAPTMAGGDDGYVYTSNSAGVDIISNGGPGCTCCALRVRGPEAENDDDRLLVSGDDPLQTLERFVIAVKEYNDHMERLDACESARKESEAMANGPRTAAEHDLSRVEPATASVYMAVASCGDVIESEDKEDIREFLFQHCNDPGEIQLFAGVTNHGASTDKPRGGFVFRGHPLEYTSEFVVDIKE